MTIIGIDLSITIPLYNKNSHNYRYTPRGAPFADRADWGSGDVHTRATQGDSKVF
jgi:hypothetical protein